MSVHETIQSDTVGMRTVLQRNRILATLPGCIPPTPRLLSVFLFLSPNPRTSIVVLRLRHLPSVCSTLPKASNDPDLRILIRLV